MDFKLEGIEKVITYYNEKEKKAYCCFVYADGNIVDVPQEIGQSYLWNYIDQVLQKRWHRTMKDIQNDSNMLFHKTQEEKEAIVKQVQAKKKKQPKKVIIPGAAFHWNKGAGFFSKVKNLAVNHKKITALVTAGALALTAFGIGSHFGSSSSPKKPKSATESINSDSKENFEQDTQQESLWIRAMEKANELQKAFLSKNLINAYLFNQQFAQSHKEEDVLFPDGHIEPVVQFGLSPEEFGTAYILGANFTKEEYSTFMNTSNISIEEYVNHWRNFERQMEHAYLIRKSNESTGLLSTVSNREGAKFLKTVDDLHKQLRAAKETSDKEAEMKALMELYALKNTSLKIEEASQLEATYENFLSLELPDYVLLAVPVFDAVAEEYRNVTLENGKHFYDERDNFVWSEEGIYCKMYEWTMLENVQNHAISLKDNHYEVDASCVSYDDLIAAVTEKQKEAGILKDSDNLNRYAVENLRAIQTALEVETVTYEEDNGILIFGGSGAAQSTESTRTETTTTEKKTEEKITKSEMTTKEKEEATKQEQKIEEEMAQENQTSQETANKKAEEAASQDQAQQDAKRDQLQQEVDQNNTKIEDAIESMKPGEGAPSNVTIDQEYQGENGTLDSSVSNPTTSGDGAYEDFPDLNGDGSNIPVLENQETTVSKEATSLETNETATVISNAQISNVEVPVVDESTTAMETNSNTDIASENQEYTVEYYEMSPEEKQAAYELFAAQTVENMATESSEEEVVQYQK